MDFLALLACFGHATTPEIALAQLSAESEVDPDDFEKSLVRLLRLGVLQRVDQALDVAVVSPGGVGTTGLLAFLNRHCCASDALNQMGSSTCWRLVRRSVALAPRCLSAVIPGSRP
jgi:hypothetical protein